MIKWGLSQECKIWLTLKLTHVMNFPHSLVGKESACNTGDLGSIPGLGRSPGEGTGNPLQDSCLENPMDRGAWWATVHGVTRVGHDWATKAPPPVKLRKELDLQWFEKILGIHLTTEVQELYTENYKTLLK